MTITEREAREFGVDVENLPKDVGEGTANGEAKRPKRARGDYKENIELAIQLKRALEAGDREILPAIRAARVEAFARYLEAYGQDELDELQEITDRELIRVYPLKSLGIDYQASGRLVAWWWDMRRDCWLVLVESGGPVTPWCVAHYRDGESERGSGRYYGSLSEAAAVWEMEQE